jgi:hypothetical protein
LDWRNLGIVSWEKWFVSEGFDFAWPFVHQLLTTNLQNIC